MPPETSCRADAVQISSSSSCHLVIITRRPSLATERGHESRPSSLMQRSCSDEGFTKMTSKMRTSHDSPLFQSSSCRLTDDTSEEGRVGARCIAIKILEQSLESRQTFAMK